MNHENRIVGVDHKHNLKKATLLRRAPNQIFLISLNQRKRWPRGNDDFFGLLWVDAVSRQVLFVPIISSKFQQNSITKLKIINYIINSKGGQLCISPGATGRVVRLASVDQACELLLYALLLCGI